MLRANCKGIIGSTFGRINLGEIRKIKIGVAKPQEQIAITNCLDKAAQCQAGAREELEVLRGLKAGLMQDLLTGKVSVAPLLEIAAA
jgi:type I restriction enzyme S subunit